MTKIFFVKDVLSVFIDFYAFLKENVSFLSCMGQNCILLYGLVLPSKNESNAIILILNTMQNVDSIM